MKVMLYGSPVAVLEQGLRDRLGDTTDFAVADYGLSSDGLTALLEGCEAMIAVRYDQVMPPAPALRLVQVPGVGYDEIGLDHLPVGAALCNVSGHGPAVAEYVVGAILMQTLALDSANAGFRTGSWARSSRMGAAPHGELSGARVGIVGYGLIGQSVAARLRPFGVTLNVCNRSDPGADGEIDGYWPIARLNDMAAQCDILILTVALTPDTEGLIDADVLAALPVGAKVVNVARGPVLDETALYRALDSGHLGGAILDVWWRYPQDSGDVAAAPAAHDFTRFPQVVVTPHISGWSVGTLSRRLDDMAENLRRLEQGKPLMNVVRAPG